MKKLLSSILVMFAIVSCDESESQLVKNPQTQLSLELSKINVEDDKIYSLQSSLVPVKRSAWSGGDEFVWLKKEISFPLNFENGEQFELSIVFQADELNKDLLILDDEDLYYWLRDWDYRSSDVEIKNFWNNNQRMYITLSMGGHLLGPAVIEIDKIQKVLVDGIEKTYIELHFSGEAWGNFDALKEHIGYSIKHGVFKGVIE